MDELLDENREGVCLPRAGHNDAECADDKNDPAIVDRGAFDELAFEHKGRIVLGLSVKRDLIVNHISH